MNLLISVNVVNFVIIFHRNGSFDYNNNNNNKWIKTRDFIGWTFAISLKYNFQKFNKMTCQILKGQRHTNSAKKKKHTSQYVKKNVKLKDTYER